jgi:ribosomal protein L7Ae-like RNA K-turn-binding protein
LDDLILDIISKCKLNNIPVIHASSRKKLGMAFSGKAYMQPKIGILSIVNYQGYEELFKELINSIQRT